MGFYIVLTLKRVWLKKESYLACQLVIFLHKSKFGEMEVFGGIRWNPKEVFVGGFLQEASFGESFLKTFLLLQIR